MRSRRISKRILTSLVGIIMVWVEILLTDDESYLLPWGTGSWPITAVRTPTSLSELLQQSFFRIPGRQGSSGSSARPSTVSPSPQKINTNQLIDLMVKERVQLLLALDLD
ncbi:hypothetical protein AVEN_166305-1 [Araneus ventricosus]|uniref:Uncharacterized protein n=1 Tax=Araneus ventricosus TaxID=182803 RepID=A0A4Y2LGT4_ARAVE|nr:hypothetical protein AVEN_166305-1 [Araneus ventricosus]